MLKFTLRKFDLEKNDIPRVCNSRSTCSPSFGSLVFCTSSYCLTKECSLSVENGSCRIAKRNSAKITKLIIFILDPQRIEGDNLNRHNVVQFAIQIRKLYITAWRCAFSMLMM